MATRITKQFALDQTFKRFVIDQAPFGYSDGSCVYMSKSNPEARCAIGALLPEDSSPQVFKYAGDFTSLVERHPDVADLFEGAEDGDPFWPALQDCHDWAAISAQNLREGRPAYANSLTNFKDPSDTEDIRGTYLARRLRELAATHGLETDSLKNPR